MSTLANLLTRTRAAADQRNAANAEAYAALVRKCANGADVSPEEVLTQLDRLDRDPGIFAEDVEVMAKRLDVAAVASSLGAREKAANVAHTKALELEAEWKAANLAVDQHFRPLLHAAIAAKGEADRGVSEARTACDTLRGSAPVELQEELARIVRERGVVSPKLLKAENELRDAESRLFAREQVIARANSPKTSPLERQGMQGEVWKAQTDIPVWKQAVEQGKAQVQALAEEMAVLNAKVAEAEKALLVV